jgi:hypothetical protein
MARQWASCLSSWYHVAGWVIPSDVWTPYQLSSERCCVTASAQH